MFTKNFKFGRRTLMSLSNEHKNLDVFAEQPLVLLRVSRLHLAHVVSHVHAEDALAVLLRVEVPLALSRLLFAEACAWEPSCAVRHVKAAVCRALFAIIIKIIKLL